MKHKQAAPIRLLFIVFGLICTGFQYSNAYSADHYKTPVLSIVTDKAPGLSTSYGLKKLTALLTSRHIAFQKVTSLTAATGSSVLLCGLSSGKGAAAMLLQSRHHYIDQIPEALTTWRTNRGQQQVVVINGFDDQGLMYGLLDAVRQASGANTPSALLERIKGITEKPAVRDRAVSMYTMNRAYWESRFYDEKYWTRYLDMLAADRFNSLVIIFGYENGGFLAPCYPYFFNVKGFPGVSMVGLSSEQQQRNLLAINRLIGMAHERGIRVTAGIWDHIYRGGVQGGGIPGNEKAPDHPTPGQVWGVTADNLTAYTKAALTQFVRQIPVDALQFRMHGESGLKKGEEEAFWTDVFKMIKATKPGLRIDMRAKELPASVIQSAVNTGINFRIDTKYWMEQMGLPYHPTRINPEKGYVRHSYGDLLRYPKRYNMCWRLWNGGTTRILLWGDPDYARRFVNSVHLYDGDGYDVNEPLATKMEAQPHDAKPFELLQSGHRYYDYEFERYWHFFQVFGRLGYNPDADPAIWNNEFISRFGTATGPLVEQALHEASGILPRIIACSYPYSGFPTTRGWAEKQRLGDLPVFAKAEGSDLCQFANFDEEAGLLLEGAETAKTDPASSFWFDQTAGHIQQLTTQIRKQGDVNNKELSSTLTDLEILAGLARYHARRIPAAVSYCLYERTKDVAMLDSAIAGERRAVEAWRGIVAAAGDFYADDLMMGLAKADLSGHWKDELIKLEQGLQVLEQKRKDAKPEDRIRISPVYKVNPAPSFGQLFRIIHTPVDHIAAGQPVAIHLQVTATAGIKWIRLCYRAVNQQLAYQTILMQATGTRDEFAATIPASGIDPAYDLMYYIEIMDKNGNGRIYPDVNKETPYKLIKLARK